MLGSGGAGGAGAGGGGSGGAGGGGGAGPCPDTATEMLLVPAPAPFCIDVVGTTYEQYLLFEDSGVVPELPDPCADVDPKLFGNVDPANVVVRVEYCQAAAYCAWVGKRLCGRIGGGAVDPDEVNDVFASEWTFACSAGGERIFPYGDELSETACHGDMLEVVPPKTHPLCEGGYPGLYDLGDNTLEWEDACRQTKEGELQCAARGAVFAEASLARCAPALEDVYFQPSTVGLGYIGIRCCADPIGE